MSTEEIITANEIRDFVRFAEVRSRRGVSGMSELNLAMMVIKMANSHDELEAANDKLQEGYQTLLEDAVDMPTSHAAQPATPHRTVTGDSHTVTSQRVRMRLFMVIRLSRGRQQHARPSCHTLDSGGNCVLRRSRHCSERTTRRDIHAYRSYRRTAHSP